MKKEGKAAMRKNRRNNTKKERIIMIASSVFVLSALTMTGIYMKSNQEAEQDDGYTLDFTALEDSVEDKYEEIAQNVQSQEKEDAPEDQVAGNATDEADNLEDDLDYLPMEVGSGTVTIPGLTDRELEEALDEQINTMESTHPGYDEYRYQVDEITHNPYQLISFLTVLYEEFTYNQVKDILPELFEEQYRLTVEEITEIRTRTETQTVTDPMTGEETETEVEVEYEWHVLCICLTNKGFDTVARGRMTQEQTELYTAYNLTYGNRSYLFDIAGIPNESIGGAGYEIPEEALSDEQFARMIREAEKYLGMAYVWGGASPETGFDCSGFVSWVINNSGNGWDVGRQTAEGLRGSCAAVPASEARPGDLVFFQGTYNTSGASHVGIYAGNGMMIHAGSPVKYSNIRTPYWEGHLLSYGRIP